MECRQIVASRVKFKSSPACLNPPETDIKRTTRHQINLSVNFWGFAFHSPEQ